MIIRPTIFARFPNLIAAQSTRLGGVSPEPYGMNLSSHVGDLKENVEENRKRFFASVGIAKDARIVYQSQIHSANVNIVNGDEGILPQSDGLITFEKNVFLAVSVADCTPVLIYAPDIEAIAAIHAGWRGTEQMIVLKAAMMLKDRGADLSKAFAFVGASASKDRYEVGSEVATLFDKRHSNEKPDGKFLLDVKGANVEQLTNAGIPQFHIEVSDLCTISDDRLHSYRRDGSRSGRMLVVFGRTA